MLTEERACQKCHGQQRNQTKTVLREVDNTIIHR